MSTAVYLNTLGHGFVFDDFRGIFNNGLVSAPTGMPEVWPILREPWRPLVQFSYAITHLAFGFDPRAYHAGNILIHAINSVLVYAIARLLADLWLPRERGPVFAVVAGLVFAVHPLHSEAVAYVWGRSSSLSTAFCLASILFVVTGHRTSSERARILWLGGAMIAGLLAWKTKEDVITLPLVISVFFWLVGRRLAAASALLIPLALLAGRWTDVSALSQQVTTQNQELILAGADHTLTRGVYTMSVLQSSVFYY